MKEAKKGTCYKCGLYFYVHDHHILAKAIFGKDGETVQLCPNCHTHFHEYSKLNTQDPTNEKEALRIWKRWLKKASLVVTSLLLMLGTTLTYNQWIGYMPQWFTDWL